MKKKPLLLLSIVGALAACAPTVANRGNILDPESLAQIKPGETTREEVATKLGTPTAISTFDDKVWYYVGRQTEQYSFLDPEVLKQQAVEIDFDDKGVVTSAKKLDLSQAADATPVDRETPTFGQKQTLLRELLGDLSHPRPDLGKQGPSGGT
ncbi:MAG: outer membrane protein assembly factor BamE [Alphaproteobacteria bacterium]|nr:outer membrane protein assembly factor BamE [Alphaproteobacteria bacterium]